MCCAPPGSGRSKPRTVPRGIALARRASSERHPDGSPVAGHGRRETPPGDSRTDARTSAIPVVAFSALALEGGVAWLLATRLRRPPREADRRRGIPAPSSPVLQRLSDDTVQVTPRNRDAGTLAIGSPDRDHRLENEARQPKEVREDVEAAHREEIHLGGEQATRRTNACYARSPSKGGLDGRPYGLPKSVLVACGRRRLAGRSRVLRIRCILPEPGAPRDEGIPRDEGLLGDARVSPVPSARSGPRTSRRSRWARRSSTSRRRVRPRWTATRPFTYGAAPSQPAIAA